MKSYKMDFRSLSFHQGWPDPGLVRLGSSLGFNNITLQTEGGTIEPLKELRERSKGYFELAEELDMTTGLWVHELEDYDEEWGSPGLQNQDLWDGLSERYEWILTELFPEINHLVLTVVESEIRVTEPDILSRLVGTLLDECQNAGKDLILRTHVWNPDEMEAVSEAISAIPEEVKLMTKSVPQDWHLRSVDNPLIDEINGERLIIEQDVAGEFFRMDAVANCFTDILERRYRKWAEQECMGVSVRVDRGWRPWEYQNSVLGEAQEANLWALGYWSSGKPISQDEVWHDYASERFGQSVAPNIIKAFKPTGQVVAEGLCVEDETFGDPRREIPVERTTESRVAEAYSDSEDELFKNPFYRRWSNFRWDPSYKDNYHKMRKGSDEIIEKKASSYLDKLQLANTSLELIEQIDRHDVPAGGKEFFQFKLEENKWHLRVMSEIELAWLRALKRLYSDSTGKKSKLLSDINYHLSNCEELLKQTGEQKRVKWRDEIHYLNRGMSMGSRAVQKVTNWEGRLRELSTSNIRSSSGARNLSKLISEFRRYFELS